MERRTSGVFRHAAGQDVRIGTSPSLGEVLAHYRDLPVVHAVRQPLYWAEDRLR
jgi:hypothetical protein